MSNNIIQPSIYKCITVKDIKLLDPDICLHKIQYVVFTGANSLYYSAPYGQ